MNINSEIYREKIIGLIIKRERKHRQLKLDDLSINLKLTPQFLSEIENGRKKLNSHTINNIFKELGITFNWEIDPFDELPLLFETYIHTYVSIDIEKRKKYANMIVENTKWQYSFYYPILILTELCSCTLEDRAGDIDYLIDKCEEIFDFFDYNQKSVYFYFKGLHYHIDNDDYLEGIKYYNKGIQINPFGEICGMAYYQLSNIYLKQLKLINSFEKINHAKKIPSQFADFRRIVWCETVIGNIFLSKKAFIKMEKQYLNTLFLAQSYGSKDNIDNICFNLAYGMMISKQYVKAIHYGEKYLKENYYKVKLYYVLAWSHFQLNNIKDCKYYLNLIESSNEKLNEEIKTYVTCLHYLIKSNYDSYFKKLVKYYSNIKSRNINFDKMIVLERIIEYCKEYQLYEEGFKYQEEYIQLIDNDSLEDYVID